MAPRCTGEVKNECQMRIIKELSESRWRVKRGGLVVMRGKDSEEDTLVRRLWHSLQAVEARFILPSSEEPPPLFPGG